MRRPAHLSPTQEAEARLYPRICMRMMSTKWQGTGTVEVVCRAPLTLVLIRSFIQPDPTNLIWATAMECRNHGRVGWPDSKPEGSW